MSDSNNDPGSDNDYEIDPEQKAEALFCLDRLESILANTKEKRDLKEAIARSLLDQSNDDSGITTGDISFNSEHGNQIPQTTPIANDDQQDQVPSTSIDDTLNQEFVIIENTQGVPDENDEHDDFSSFINRTLDTELETKLQINAPQANQQTIEQDEFTGIFNQQFYNSIRRTKTKQRARIPFEYSENIQAQPHIHEPDPFKRVIEQMTVGHERSENMSARPNFIEDVSTNSENGLDTCVKCERTVELYPDIGFAYCSPCDYAFCTSCGNAYHGGQDCHRTTSPALNTHPIVREMEARLENVSSQRRIREERAVREREILEMERHERVARERERVERDLIDKERAIREQERRERDRLERERQEREVREQERAERDRIEKDRIDRERAIREEEIRERDRLERERQLMENERLERERREREARELESKRRREQRRKDDKASEQLIKNSCKKCPGCSNYIESSLNTWITSSLIHIILIRHICDGNPAIEPYIDNKTRDYTLNTSYGCSPCFSIVNNRYK
ncbi:unnamed protein product [Oppiella nova]|uniref:IBR domain-containing protein n=1 Tax=Oppiella nova TaxID=334625 RepID=A0A7R9M078_9ACAR|nr:unnamed protein product [Oppiella nova]CAG2168071.1 unnamed protein product [Oppiella nova]